MVGPFSTSFWLSDHHQLQVQPTGDILTWMPPLFVAQVPASAYQGCPATAEGSVEPLNSGRVDPPPRAGAGRHRCNRRGAATGYTEHDLHDAAAAVTLEH